MREGSLEPPVRHPLDWNNPDFYDEALLDKELRRVCIEGPVFDLQECVGW